MQAHIFHLLCLRLEGKYKHFHLRLVQNMKLIQTKLFGEIGVDPEKLIVFEEGIIGFDFLKQFLLITDEENSESSISWLQSVDEPNFAMPVMDPLLIDEGYNPVVEDELLKTLGDFQDENLLVMVTVSVPSQLENMTANMKAPMIINGVNRRACQIIIDNDEYQVKYPIYEIFKEK